MRVSAVTAPGTPWHDSWLHFETGLATQPQLIEPRFYLGGQLGSEESALSQLRRGRRHNSLRVLRFRHPDVPLPRRVAAR